MKMNARSLIIDLFLAYEGQVMSTKQMIMAARVFDISENGVRVAVTRLASEGVIELVERGMYQLSAQSQDWASVMLNRRAGLKPTRQWNQHYLAVFTGLLGRVDRTALNRRERALRRYGFRELEQGIFVRPDNLDIEFALLFEQLKATGHMTEASMSRINSFDPQTSLKVKKLWPSATLNSNYQKFSQQIQQWLAGVDQLPLEQAARESLLLGRQTISLLMNDPLLPEPFVNVTAREQFASDVQALDQLGQTLWRQLYEHMLSNS